MAVKGSTQYDSLGSKYAPSKRAPKPAPEEHTMRCLLGRLDGARVLDLACGVGHYSRLAKDLGASSVVGVDISEETIARARRIEAEQPRGIDYHVYDVAELPRLGTFDVIIAVWLFNYATSPDHMAKMFAAIHKNLAPEGRLVAITIAPEYDPHGPTWEPYGMRVVEASPSPQRVELVVDILTQPPTRMEFFRWDRQVYNDARRQAGFDSLTWHAARIPRRAICVKGEDYWNTYRENPFVTALECH